jgi:hypothetical protein
MTSMNHESNSMIYSIFLSYIITCNWKTLSYKQLKTQLQSNLQLICINHNAIGWCENWLSTNLNLNQMRTTVAKALRKMRLSHRCMHAHWLLDSYFEIRNIENCMDRKVLLAPSSSALAVFLFNLFISHKKFENNSGDCKWYISQSCKISTQNYFFTLC